MRLLATALLVPLILAAAGPAPLPHCQIPCGIYGDRMRIDMLLEDAATIEKGMKTIAELGAADETNWNQIVRWTVNKEEHAQGIQNQVAQYWLAQRIKAPQGEDEAQRKTYLAQLQLLHGITVAAMKCKQTTDVANVAKLRELCGKFSETYFSPEDLEHLRSHREK